MLDDIQGVAVPVHEVLNVPVDEHLRRDQSRSGLLQQLPPLFANHCSIIFGEQGFQIINSWHFNRNDLQSLPQRRQYRKYRVGLDIAPSLNVPDGLAPATKHLGDLSLGLALGLPLRA